MRLRSELMGGGRDFLTRGYQHGPPKHKPTGPPAHPAAVGLRELGLGLEENSAGSAGNLQKIAPVAAQRRDIPSGSSYKRRTAPVRDGPKSREDNGLSSPRSSAAGAISRA